MHYIKRASQGLLETAKSVTSKGIDTVNKGVDTVSSIFTQIRTSRRPNCVAISPDGKLAVSGSHSYSWHWGAYFNGSDRRFDEIHGGTVWIWDTKTGEVKNEIKVSSNPTVVSFSPDNKLIATGHTNGEIKIWYAATGEHKRDLRTKLTNCRVITSVAFSPNSKRVASGCDEVVRIWDVATGGLQQKLRGHRDSVTSVAFSPDGNRVASGSWDMTIRIWNVEEKKQNSLDLEFPERHVRGEREKQEIVFDNQRPVLSVAFSPDNNLVAGGLNWGGHLNIWDIKERKRKHEFIHYSPKPVKSVSFFPDGNRLVSISNGNICIWDIKNAPPPHGSSPYPHDHRREPIRDWASRAYHSIAGRQLETLRAHKWIPYTDNNFSVSVSGNGLVASSSYNDNTIRIWAPFIPLDTSPLSDDLKQELMGYASTNYREVLRINKVKNMFPRGFFT